VAGTRSRGMGLSTRITLLTFVSVTAAVALVSVISLVGVYRSTQGEEMARLDAFRTLVTGSLDARFTSAERSIDSLASEAGTSAVGAFLRSTTIDELLEPRADVLDALAFVDARGMLASSDDVTSPPHGITSAVAGAAPRTAVFAWESDGGDGGRLWVGRTAGDGTRTVTVLARVRDTYLRRTLDDVASTRGTLVALVVDGAGRPVLTSGAGRIVDPASIVFSQDGTEAVRGTVAASSPGLGDLAGSWELVTPDHGLGWRVLVVEANADALARSGTRWRPHCLPWCSSSWQRSSWRSSTVGASCGRSPCSSSGHVTSRQAATCVPCALSATTRWVAWPMRSTRWACA